MCSDVNLDSVHQYITITTHNTYLITAIRLEPRKKQSDFLRARAVMRPGRGCIQDVAPQPPHGNRGAFLDWPPVASTSLRRRLHLDHASAHTRACAFVLSRLLYPHALLIVVKVDPYIIALLNASVRFITPAAIYRIPPPQHHSTPVLDGDPEPSDHHPPFTVYLSRPAFTTLAQHVLRRRLTYGKSPASAL